MFKPLRVQLPLPQLSYPCGGGEQVLVSELEAVDLLQDHRAVLFALEEVCAAEYSGDTLGLVSLDQHCGGGVVRLHAPVMGEKRAGGKEQEGDRGWIGGVDWREGSPEGWACEGGRMKMGEAFCYPVLPEITYIVFMDGKT